MTLDHEITDKIFTVKSTVQERLDFINKRIDASASAIIGKRRHAKTKKEISALLRIAYPTMLETPGASLMNPGSSKILAKIKQEVYDHEGGYIYFADLETNSKLSYLKDGDILQFSYIKTPVHDHQLDFSKAKVLEVFGKTRDNRPLSSFATNVSHFTPEMLEEKGLTQDQLALFSANLFDYKNKQPVPPLFVGHNWRNADIGKWIGVSMEEHGYMTVDQALEKSHDTYFDAKVLQKNVLGSSKGMRINGAVSDVVAGYDLSGAHDAANDIGATAAIYTGLYQATKYIDLTALKQVEDERKTVIPNIVGGGDLGYTFDHHSPQISVLIKLATNINHETSKLLGVKPRPRVFSVSYLFDQKELKFYDVNYADGFKLSGNQLSRLVDHKEIMDAILESQNVKSIDDIPYQDVSNFYQNR